MSMSLESATVAQDQATVEATRKYFEHLQSSYDLLWMNKKNLAMHYGFWDSGTKSLHDALVNQNRYVAELLGVERSDVVLDAGCGVGGTAIQFAETYGCRVTGVTISEKQVTRARNHAARRRVQELVSVELSDYCDTGFPDGSFDKAYALESMCYAQDKGRFLREMARILRPGGVLVIADAFLDGRHLQSADAGQLQDWLAGWAVPNILSAGEFRGACADAGLTITEDRTVQDMIIPSAKRIRRMVGLIYPFDKMLNRVGLLSDITLQSDLAALAQYRLFVEGIMDYRLFRIERPR